MKPNNCYTLSPRAKPKDVVVLRLPVPDIKEDSALQHSEKQSGRREDSNRLRPPKLRRSLLQDLNLNRSHSSSFTLSVAQPISFRGVGGDGSFEVDALHLSSSYEPSLEETYFEQCFINICKIGEGSFGEVFKVCSKEDGGLYAVKMSKQLFRSKTYRQERLEEVRRYEQFSGQENCVRFYRAWEQNDRLYMQMELCRENLESYMERQRKIPEDKVWSILLDLLLALKSLHDRNLIHLDIKLDNVLIGNDESCKLGDFGLVVDVEAAKRQATEGDCRYMAPEIMTGNFSKAADIFSLGIALLELSCFLELPANGPLWQQLREGVLPEEFLQKISEELQNLIKQMMAPQPENRPTVDQLLAHKKLTELLAVRKRWLWIKKLKQAIHRAQHTMVSKLYKITSTVLTFVRNLLMLGSPKRPEMKRLKRKRATPSKLPMVTPVKQARIISSTPTMNGYGSHEINCFDNYDDPFNITQHCTPGKFDMLLGESTPLNHHQNGQRVRNLSRSIIPLGLQISSNESETVDQEVKPVRRPLDFTPGDEMDEADVAFLLTPLAFNTTRKRMTFDSD